MSDRKASRTARASDWHRVGAGLSVRFAMRSDQIDAEWSPRVPTRREWKRVLDRYRVARHQFLSAIAAEVGGPVVCVEVPE